MTAELVEDVTLRMPRWRDWTWAGESAVVDVPFPVELRPAELVGPRRRS